MKYSKRTLVISVIVSSLAIVGVASAASGGLQNWIEPAPKEPAVLEQGSPSSVAAPSVTAEPTTSSIPTTGTPSEPSTVSTSPSQAPSAQSVPSSDVSPSTESVTPPAPTAVDPGNGVVTPVLTDQQRQDLTVVNPGH